MFFSGDHPSDWRSLIELCWQEDPESRPNFSKILSKIRVLDGGASTSLVDKMILRLEYYTKHLEDIVEERLGFFIYEFCWLACG